LRKRWYPMMGNGPPLTRMNFNILFVRDSGHEPLTVVHDH